MKLRSFLVGLASGIVVCVLVIVAMLLHEASKANKKVKLDELPALQFTDPSSSSKFQPVDSNWLISDLNGHNVNFSSFRGKVIFLHFWATWCQPCITEMPSIQRLQNKTKNMPVAYVLVSQEDPGIVHSYMNMLHSSLPAYVATTHQGYSYLAFEFPTTIIIDKNGFVVFRHVGIARWDDEASVRFLANLAKAH